VEALVEEGDVEVADVALLEGASVGNAVANHLVHRPVRKTQRRSITRSVFSKEGAAHLRAHAPREHVVAEWTGVSVALHALVVNDLINLERCDPWPDRSCGDVENLTSELEHPVGSSLARLAPVCGPGVTPGLVCQLTVHASRIDWISLSSRILPFQSLVFLLTRAE